MKSELAAVVWFVLSAPAVVGAAQSADPPSATLTVALSGESLTLWPYTAADFSGAASDPVNLIFEDVDPRALRQALMTLDGQRPPFAMLPGAACTWIDAMGDEQAAYGEPAGWVGGEVQLACTDPARPLGAPFRFHLRLFRVGPHVLGAAHLDFLIPGTAQHEALSWDLPRVFVTYDLARTGTLRGAPGAVTLGQPGKFRVVRRPIYDALVAGGAGPFLAFLGLVPPAAPGVDVPIPASRQATVLSSAAGFDAVQSDSRSALDVAYDVVIPKPFCSSGPADYVRLQGPLRLALRVHTTPSGKYQRDYTVTGLLRVTPLASGAEAADALVSEVHRAMLTDRRDEVIQQNSQVLLGDPPQSLITMLAAGGLDAASSHVSCGLP